MERTFPDDNSRPLLYHLPPVRLFYSENWDILAQKLHNWLRLRPWCLQQVLNPPEDGRVLMTNQQWRTALEGRFVKIPYDDRVRTLIKSRPSDVAQLPDSEPVSKRPRAAHKGRKDNGRIAESRLADRIDINVRFGVHARFAPYDPEECVLWGGASLCKATIMGDDRLRQEVVWELSVAQFRLEFLALDRTILDDVYNDADTSLGARREFLICNIWGNGHIRPSWDVEGTKDDPFGSGEWRERVEAVETMARVVSIWPYGDRAKAPPPGWASNSFVFEDFEFRVFRFYAETFHACMGRRPTLPLLQPPSTRRHVS